MTDDVISPEELVTPGEALEMLGMSWATLNRLTTDGLLACVQLRPHGWRRYRRKDIEALMTPSRANLTKAGLLPNEVEA